MKRVILLVLSLFFFQEYSFAVTASIAAIVGDRTITVSEVQQQKKMTSYFGNVGSLSPEQDKEYTKMVLESMIDDEVLSQYADKVGLVVSDEEIENYISNIETNGKLQPGQLVRTMVNNLHIPAKDFKKQIRIEVLRTKILRESLAQTISITKDDVESLVLSTNFRDAQVHLKVFTGKDNTDKTYKNLFNLRSKITSCKKLGSLNYKHFATLSDIHAKLSELAINIQTLVKDMGVGQASEVVKGDDMKIIVLCEKKIDQFTQQDSNSVAQFLGNKKLNLKAKKFFQNLRKKTYVKVLL